jgi:hypothetical protein
MVTAGLKKSPVLGPVYSRSHNPSYALMTSRNRILFTSLLVVSILICGLGVVLGSETVTEIPKSESPNHSLALFVVASSTNSVEKLALMSLGDKTTLADFAMTNAVSGLRRSSSSTTGIAWKHDSTGVAVSFSDKTQSCIFACVTVRGGRSKWIDLGVVEGPNLGILGRERSDFLRVEHVPTHWTDADDWSRRMVWVRNRFWDKRGQRYTVEQEFSISPTGEIGWK